MEKPQNRVSAISAALDFDLVGASEEKRPEALSPEPPAQVAPLPEPSLPATQSSHVEPVAPVIRRASVHPHKKANAPEKDVFVRNVALAALAGLGVVMAGLLYFRSVQDAGQQSYLSLPETVINRDGQVARVQLTVQVRRQDAGWLTGHQQQIKDQLHYALAQIDLDTLRSENGAQQMQADLRDTLNHALGEDKIESVLITDLLMQGR